MNRFDIGIIGGGPAGYTAAFKASEEGLSVILFERDKIGGVCLNRGCIPTKTILHSAELYEECKCSQDLGILTENLSFDWKKVIEHKNSIVEKLRRNLELSLKNAKVTVINLKAEIKNGKIVAGAEEYECSKIINATGSEPKEFPNLKFDHDFVLSSDDVLEMEQLPKSILIIGSGAIGIEWARIFSAFDVDVTIVETAEHLLPLADIEVSKRVERIFKTKGIKYYLSDTVEQIDNLAHKVILKSGEEIFTDKILLAVGRKPNNSIKEGICIGDACGKIQLAHFAIKQAIKEISGIDFNESLVPSVVYGTPEIAWIGKREQDLSNEEYKKSMILISALGKSHCDNATEGFIKLLSIKDKIVGAHIVSKEASALIQQIEIAMHNDIAIEELKKICFAHPTYSEGIFESLFKIK